MASADELLALDVAVADPAAVVRALVGDDDQLAGPQACDRHRAGTIARGHDLADLDERQLVQLRPTVVRVVAQLVENLRVDRPHGATLRNPSDVLVPATAPSGCNSCLPRGSALVSFDVAAVVVHIDLEGDRPHSSSLVALAAGRQLASSWGATLYAALIAKDTSGIDAAALGKAGADKIMVATTDTPIAPLWAAVGNAWQAVLDQLRPRIVLFGADAPSAPELAPRTGARIGARLLVRARTFGGDEIELRDRDGGYVRASDGGAAVALVGRAGEAVPGEDDADIVVIAGGSGDARIELAGAVAAEVAHTVGAVVALGEDAAKDPALVARANQLAQQLGAIVVGPVEAARAGAIAPGAVVDRQTPLAPELCVVVGDAKVDLAGSTSVIKIGAQPGKLVDGALPGPVAAGLASLVDKLGRTA